MIGLSRLKRACLVLAVNLVTLGVVTAGFVTHPAAALAAALDTRPAAHVVIFDSQGTQTQHVTTAATVGAFLQERGIRPRPADYVHPDPATPLTDNTVVQYSPQVAVTLVTSSGRHRILTTAPDVGALLEETGLHLGRYDIVRPSLADPIVANATIRIARVVKWVATKRNHVAPRTIHKISFSMPPGESRVISAGREGLRETMVDYTATDGKVHSRVVATRLVRKPKPRVVADGVGTPAAIRAFEKRGLEKTSYIAASALDMVATAYTAQCAGCSGYTASGYRAGHGIVAVDPSIIPLGTKLYIPGYGFAVAGDTGGAIVGNRIDLGFDSISDALAFGRRTVRVYRLK